MRTILTEHHEVVVSHWEGRVQLTIQSKKRVHDDYHLSQAGTTATTGEARQIALALCPDLVKALAHLNSAAEMIGEAARADIKEEILIAIEYIEGAR